MRVALMVCGLLLAGCDRAAPTGAPLCRPAVTVDSTRDAATGAVVIVRIARGGCR